MHSLHGINPYGIENHKSTDVDSGNLETKFTFLETQDNNHDPKGRIIIAELTVFKTEILRAIYSHLTTRETLESGVVVETEFTNLGSIEHLLVYGSHTFSDQEIKILKTLIPTIVKAETHASVLKAINGSLSTCQSKQLQNVIFDALMALVALPKRQDIYGDECCEKAYPINKLLNMKRIKKLQWPVKHILNTLTLQSLGQLKPGNFNIEEEIYSLAGGYVSPIFVTEQQLTYLQNNSDSDRVIPVKNPYAKLEIPDTQTHFNFEEDVDDLKKSILLHIVTNYMTLKYEVNGEIRILTENAKFEAFVLENIFAEESELDFEKAKHSDTSKKGMSSVIDFLKEMNLKNSVTDIHDLLLKEADTNPGTNREILYLDMYRRSLKSNFEPVLTHRGPVLVRNITELKNALIHEVHYHYMNLSNINPKQRGLFDRFVPIKPSIDDIQNDKLDYRGKAGGLGNGQIGRINMDKFLRAMAAADCDNIEKLANVIFQAFIGDIVLSDDTKHTKTLDGPNRSFLIYRLLCQNTLLEIKTEDGIRYSTIDDYIVRWLKALPPETDLSFPAYGLQEDLICQFGQIIILQLCERLSPQLENIQELADRNFSKQAGNIFGVSEAQDQALKTYENLLAQQKESQRERVILKFLQS